MTHNKKPSLLLLTSSFPRSPYDETCGYIRDFARTLAADFNITILAPPDKEAIDWKDNHFRLVRSRSILPLSIDPFLASVDLNQLGSQGVVIKLAAMVSLICFCARAFSLSLKSDVMCSHWMVPAGFVGSLLSLVTRKPHIIVEHSGAAHLLTRAFLGKTISRFVSSQSNRIVVVSKDLKDKLIALDPSASSKMEVIPMGVAQTRPVVEISSCERPTTILFIGRLTEIKGLDLILRAMTVDAQWRLIVAGDGDRRDELEALAKRLSVDATFLGSITASRRNQLFENCDVVVVPSRVLASGRTEGTPVVCLEAMAAGKTVVASRVGGLAEIIVDGQNGLLFEPGNHHELRRILTSVLGNSDLRKKLGLNARVSVEQNVWPQIGRRYAAIINDALRENEFTGNRRIEASSLN